MFQVWHYVNPSQREITGVARCRLTDIMMAEEHTLELDLTWEDNPREDRGRIKISADTLKSKENIVKCQISGKLRSKKILCFGSDHPYLIIERSKSERFLDFVQVLKTKYDFKKSNPEWEPF